MDKAIKSYGEKEFSSIRKTAKEYKVPLVTLYEQIKGKATENVGRPTAMSREEEDVLAERCILIANWGYP